TNTGLLAARCLVGSEVGIIGDRDRPLALPIVRPGERGLLLFPDDDAVPIATFTDADQPLVLVVPDGNWRQAAKMRHRVPGLDVLTCVTLPSTTPTTTYRLRAEPRAGGLATLEAIAHAIGLLEGTRGPAIEAAMLAVFQVMVERTLRARGTA
ncbi:MAG: DTW domain-containing protein, partial [Proteobacteria bacterium]|nr:DTW domain-containing protein [Pseudomonadota bacterium]